MISIESIGLQEIAARGAAVARSAMGRGRQGRAHSVSRAEVFALSPRTTQETHINAAATAAHDGGTHSTSTMPGGAHENMKAWSPEEDTLIIAMHESEGPKWSKIVQRLPGRTVSSVRNRWQRIEKGRKLREAGVESKNRCHACGQPKRGHVCYAKLNGGPQVDVRSGLSVKPSLQGGPAFGMAPPAPRTNLKELLTNSGRTGSMSDLFKSEVFSTDSTGLFPAPPAGSAGYPIFRVVLYATAETIAAAPPVMPGAARRRRAARPRREPVVLLVARAGDGRADDAADGGALRLSPPTARPTWRRRPQGAAVGAQGGERDCDVRPRHRRQRAARPPPRRPRARRPASGAASPRSSASSSAATPPPPTRLRPAQRADRPAQRARRHRAADARAPPLVAPLARRGRPDLMRAVCGARETRR